MKAPRPMKIYGMDWPRFPALKRQIQDQAFPIPKQRISFLGIENFHSSSPACLRQSTPYFFCSLAIVVAMWPLKQVNLVRNSTLKNIPKKINFDSFTTS